jgi:hypothetical protein
LPTYLQAPNQAMLDALPNSLDKLLASQAANIEPANFVQAGFGSAITAFVPRGQSSYNGLQAGLARKFDNGLTIQSAYTWSHAIDNSTADFHTSDITPRRPQDFFNFASEKANSALDRAQRLTLAIVYELPTFKSDNWMIKNVLGNWTLSPVYTFESGEWVTVQAQQDANLNGDPAGDRVIVNPAGVRGTGTDVSPLTAVSGPNAGSVVAYVANNPNAQFIRPGLGALANGGRNNLQTPGTNNIDLGIYKNLNIREGIKFRFGAQFANIVNHPQFIPGSNPGFGLGVNDVAGFASVGTGYTAFVTPGSSNFNNPKAVFASNARTIALTAKLSF